MAKVVYLDQNAWIYLSRAYYGRTSNEGLARALKSVTEASASGTIFPLSLVHYEETVKRVRDDGGRQRLSAFMIKISKGYAIRPYTSLFTTEIYNAILLRLGIPQIPFNVVKKGISNMLGSKATIEGNIPDYLKKEMEELTETPEVLLMLFNDKATRKEVQREWDKTNERLVKILETTRKEEAQIANKNDRYKWVLYKLFRDMIIPDVAKFVSATKIRPEVVSLNTLNQMEEFLRDVPTIHVLFSLMYSRDLEKSREIAKNDFNDVNGLSIAIPYCNAVVTDKFWAAKAKQLRLDKKYNTRIYSSIQDI